MGSVYALSIRYEVYESLLPMRGASKNKILEWFDAIQKDPFTQSDFIDKELDGNHFSVKVIGRFAVFYYVDHAIKEVKIVRIHPAD